MNYNTISPSSWGLNELRKKQMQQYPRSFVGRITTVHKGGYRVITTEGESLAQVSGKLLHSAQDGRHLPAVGDFVLLDRLDDTHGDALIHNILPRTSLFTRAAPGGGTQVVAANIDTAFLCMSLNQDFNLRRLERYLATTWESSALPVVVLTKSDLCDDVPAKLAAVSSVAIGVEILVVSSLSGDGADALQPYLSSGATAAFLGSSGVGKSTLINYLLGSEKLATGGIRQDGKGRHTTTHRELILLPQGCCVIDTPGMRELGLDSADINKSFSDISELAQHCRFRDCSHTQEPGCAVNAAVEAGQLSAGRLESYQKLQKELGYDGLTARQIEEKKIQSMMGGFGAMKEFRQYNKEKNRRRGG